jgi:hypothetical protein
MLNGGMTAKEAAAVARAYKRGGVGAGLFATGYYAAEQGVSVDSKGNLKLVTCSFLNASLMLLGLKSLNWDS